MELTQKMQKKIENGREYRSLSLGAINDDEFIVEGYATTFDQPYYLYTAGQTENGEDIIVYEQVDKDAFKDADMSDVIFQYDHEGRVFARLSNDTMKLESDDHGLKTTAYLGGTEIGRNLYEEIKGGYTNKMSFGFTVKADDIKPYGDKDYIRTIKEVKKLFDVSAVSYPQNDFTEIYSARKQIDGVIEELEAERLKVEEERRKVVEQKENLLKRLNAMKGAKNGN